MAMTKAQALDYLYRHQKELGTQRNDELANILVQSNIAPESLSNVKLCSPSNGLLLAILGLDRFYYGEYFLGIIKIITCCGFYIWGIIDIINAKKNTHKANFNKISRYALTGSTIGPTIDLNTIKTVVTNKEVQQSVKELGGSLKDLQKTMEMPEEHEVWIHRR